MTIHNIIELLKYRFYHIERDKNPDIQNIRTSQYKHETLRQSMSLNNETIHSSSNIKQ